MKSHVNHPSRESIQAFAEGRLVNVDSSYIEEHLLNCDTCCDHLANLEDGELIELARRANELETSEMASLEHGSIPVALKNHPRYKVIDSIAVGAMGVVFRAEHLLMRRTVALKVIHPSFLSNSQAIRRFHQEVRVAARLNHPNIVASHDAEQAGELHFLVMEYVDGVTLAQYVERHGPTTVTQACNWLRQAISALQHAHQLGLTHRDIKPANLMVDQDGKLKILDFGLSRLDPVTWSPSGDRRADKSSATLPDMFLGTPGYVSPEQIANASQADIRSDIYSLGCTLYFLLAGRPPFTRDSIVQTLHAQQSDPMPDIGQRRKDVPQRLVQLLNRMTAKCPEERFASPSELLDALDEIHLPGNQDETLNTRTELAQDTHRSFLNHAVSDTPVKFSRTSKKLSKQQQRKWIAVGAASLVAILLGGIVLSSIANQWQPVPQANLLVLMPSSGLSYDDYHALNVAANRSNVKLDFASSTLATANWYDGYGTGTAAANLLVGPEIKTFQYDGVVFIGCDTSEFLPGTPVGREVNRIINEFHTHDKLLISLGAGQRVLGKHGMLQGIRVAQCPPLLSEQTKYAGALMSENELEQDGNIITASVARGSSVARCTSQLMQRILQVLEK